MKSKIRKNTPIADLIASYENDDFDFGDDARVRRAALRYVDGMEDSHSRALLYVLATSKSARQVTDTQWQALVDAEHRTAVAASARADVLQDLIDTHEDELSEVMETLGKVLYALTERQAGNIIRSEDEYIENARTALREWKESRASRDFDPRTVDDSE